MYTIELRRFDGKTTVVINIETVKFKKKKDAQEWLEEFAKCLTTGTRARVVEV